MKAGLALTVLILNVFAIISILSARRGTVRKFVWTAVVVLIPLLGSVSWFAVGRGRSRTRG